MSTCDKCWDDALSRTTTQGGTVVEHYFDLLKERRDDPCPDKEQHRHDYIRFRQQGHDKQNERMVDAVIQDRGVRRGCPYQPETEERERVKIRRDLRAALSIYCPQCCEPILFTVQIQEKGP